jgi:HlyD family secretion protein
VAGGEAARERRSGPPKVVYRLTPSGALEPVALRTGVTDGSFTEVLGGELSAGDAVVIGLNAESSPSNLTPPPGFGSPGGRRR